MTDESPEVLKVRVSSSLIAAVLNVAKRHGVPEETARLIAWQAVDEPLIMNAFGLRTFMESQRIAKGPPRLPYVLGGVVVGMFIAIVAGWA